MNGFTTFSVNRFDHVVLDASDVEFTASWYVRVLGMTCETFGAGRIALRFGDQKLNLRPTQAPNWVTAAVDAHLRACGIEITDGPVTKTGALGPLTSHYCRDPDGNLIEVATHLRAD